MCVVLVTLSAQEAAHASHKKGRKACQGPTRPQAPFANRLNKKIDTQKDPLLRATLHPVSYHTLGGSQLLFKKMMWFWLLRPCFVYIQFWSINKRTQLQFERNDFIDTSSLLQAMQHPFQRPWAHPQKAKLRVPLHLYPLQWSSTSKLHQNPPEKPRPAMAEMTLFWVLTVCECHSKRWITRVP